MSKPNKYFTPPEFIWVVFDSEGQPAGAALTHEGARRLSKEVCRETGEWSILQGYVHGRGVDMGMGSTDE